MSSPPTAVLHGESLAAAAASGAPLAARCMVADTTACVFTARTYARRAMGPHDVVLDMKYCGLCHTDVHAAAGHVDALMGGKRPCVPGHELAGLAVAVGAAVTRVRVGDAVGVGCMVDSCQACAACRRGEQQFCARMTATYGGAPRERSAVGPGAPAWTLGGYTTAHVVDERFCVIIPRGFPLEMAGPVMCAGVTVFDPLRRHGAGAGTRVGVVGVGGLGGLAIKIAKAMGCVVTAITRSPAKAAAARRGGADAVLVSTDAGAMSQARASLDLILDTVPASHDLAPYRALLAPGRTPAGRQRRLVILGLSPELVAGFVMDIVACGGSRVVGGNIGSVECTQAVIDLCAEHKIYPDVEVIPVEGLHPAYTALAAGNDSSVRYVLDLASLDEGAADRCRAVPPPNLGPAPPAISPLSIISSILGMLCCCRCCR